MPLRVPRRISTSHKAASEIASLAASEIVSLASYVSTPEDQLKAAVVVGLASTSFLAFFLVIPQFSDAFRGSEDSWNDIYPTLATSSALSSIKPSDASDRVNQRKAVLLDVRFLDKHIESHPAKSRPVPLYRPIEGWNAASILRRAGFFFFGVQNSERDPDFIPSLSLAAPKKNQEVILICDTGGSVESKVGALKGFQSRSLKAAYYLIKEGYSRVSFVEGGFQQWVRDGLNVAEGVEDFEEQDEFEGQGNSPLSALSGIFKWK